MATTAQQTAAAKVAAAVLARITAIDAKRRELSGERYKDSETLLENVKVVGEDISPSGFKRPVIEINGERKPVAFHRSATPGLESYNLVIQTAPEAFQYLDRAGNAIKVPAGTERYVLKDAA